MGGGFKGQCHLAGPTSYRSIPISLHANLTTPSWDIAISKLDLENLRSMSWAESQVQRRIDSYPFRSMSIEPPIFQIWLVYNSAMKIQGQGHWGSEVEVIYRHGETHRFSYNCHNSDIIMGAIASQITSLTIVYSIVHSGADQRQHQSSASLAFVWGIHRWPVNSPHKWPVTRKMFLFDDVIMLCALRELTYIDIHKMMC